MKRILSLMLVAVSLLLCLGGCAKDKADPTAEAQANRDKIAEKFADVKSFSFEALLQQYGENDDAGVQRNGFKNMDTQEISSPEEAIERAKEEVTDADAYDMINVSYDSEMCVICVDFGTVNTTGGISVYMRTNGTTVLIVAGE